MISSQDGTEDRRPRAAFRPWRVVCSPTASAWAGATVVGGGWCRRRDSRGEPRPPMAPALLARLSGAES